MKIFLSLLFLVCILLRSNAQDHVFQRVDTPKLNKDVLWVINNVTSYDSVFIMNRHCWGNMRTSFIHFYKGRVSIGVYCDRYVLDDFALNEKMYSKENSNPLLYQDKAIVISTKRVNKQVLDTVAVFLPAAINSLVQSPTDKVYDSCSNFSNRVDDSATIQLFKVTPYAIEQGYFYALDFICKYCPENIQFKKIKGTCELFERTYHHVGGLIKKAIAKDIKNNYQVIPDINRGISVGY